MANRYLLDTGIVGAYLNNDRKIRRRLQGMRFYLSIIVVGELYHGILNANNRRANLKTLREFTFAYKPLLISEVTTEKYGVIATALQSKLIPQNDIWIAAQAIQLNLTLITFDKDFERVPDLKHENWL